MKKLYTSMLAVVGSALLFAGSALAAADAALTTQVTGLQTYFTDNIGTVIAAFVAISMLLWLLSIAFRSVGVKKPSKVG